MATLIESLTALGIFAIGSSVSATWVGQSSQRSAQAARQLRALVVATDMEARLRANPEGVRAGDYQYAIPASFDCTVKGCLANQIAAVDLAVFHDEVARALGRGATGAVRCDGGRCVIHLRWPGGHLDWGAR
ncbi:MAG: hypothetical protein WBW32_20440 [Luteibacter sp.]